MIVKDEAPSIVRVLESVLPAVDHIAILDTGSTDDTPQIASKWLVNCGATWTVRGEPFVAFDKITDRRIIDFAATRNRALEIAAEKNPVFTLMMSGDETLSGAVALLKFLDAHRDAPEDAYAVTMRRGEKTWRYPRILRTGGGRRYVFPIHETPVGKNGETDAELVPGVFVDYAPPDDARLLKRMREVDIPVLTVLAEAKIETQEDHVARTRALMFLGQTHENLALEYPKDDLSNARATHLMQAMSYYYRRAAIDGDVDDANYAMFHFLDVADKLELFSHEELMTRYQALAERDPLRPETHYKAAFHASQIDPRLAAQLAQKATEVAREAKTHPPAFSTDSRIEWLSLQILAESAKLLNYPARAKKAAEEGIAAGGPEAAFREYI